MNKALREAVEGLQAAARQYGATIEEAYPAARGGHLKLDVRPSTGKLFTHAICSTPSDHRSRLNDLSDFKRRLRQMGAVKQ